jgi:hypothetical protein
MERLRTQFSSAVEQILSPSSNKQLKEATNSIEILRKLPEAFDFFILLLREKESEERGEEGREREGFGERNQREGVKIIASQSLLWICKRSIIKEYWMNEIISLLSLSFSRPVSSSLYRSLACLILRSITETQLISSFYEAFSQSLSSEIFLLTFSCIPELCLSTEIHKGTKEEIENSAIQLATSCFKELPFLISFFDSLISEIPNINEFIVTAIDADNSNSFYIIAALLSDWMKISRGSIAHHQLNIPCPSAEILLSSHCLSLVFDGMSAITRLDSLILSDSQRDFFLSCSEV